MRLDFFSDPGHGWLKVKRKLLFKFHLHTSITRCSYQYGEYVYLEEDLDAQLLLRTLEDNDIAFQIREHNTNRTSRIRGYERFERFRL